MKKLFTFERVLAVAAVLMCAVLLGYIALSNSTVTPIEIVYEPTTVLSMDALTVQATAAAEPSSNAATLAQTTVGSDTAAASSAVRTTVRAATAAAATQSGRINVNTASAEQLTALDGIGTVLAGRIVQYRESVGRFTKAEDLLNVSGIGEKKLAAIVDDIEF